QTQRQNPMQQMQMPMQGQNPMQRGQQDPEQRLLALATQLATQLGQPPQVYANALKNVMTQCAWPR
ncbi:MAG TPA: hypothetical protein VG125_16755, partial [Pirellulales bacterium]|nr:hypothetical protein [Pirellulales bacterium]